MLVRGRETLDEEIAQTDEVVDLLAGDRNGGRACGVIGVAGFEADGTERRWRSCP